MSDSLEHVSQANNKQAELVQSIERSADLLSGRIPTSARVKLPAEEHLTVELVPLGLVQRLEEAKGDLSLFQSFFWTLFGTLLGVITTLVLAPSSLTSVDKATWVTICALLLAIGIFGFLWNRASNRADKIREKTYMEHIDD